MQFHLPAIEAAAAGSRRILTGLLGNIGDRLSGATPLSDGNIHEIRKTCKKLRALLRLLHPGLEDAQYLALDRQIRDFARHLSGLRDGKVMRDTLDHLGRHFAPVLQEEALAPIHEALGHVTRLHHGAPATRPDSARLLEQLAEITALAERLDDTRIDAGTLLTGLTAGYRRGRRALARMEAAPDTENGHRLRRQAKYQYNQLRLLAAWNEAELKPLIDAFHELEDTLGKDHDLAVLGETLGRHPDLCRDGTRRELLVALIESRRIALMTRALRLARELYRDKPRACRQRLENAFAQALAA